MVNLFTDVGGGAALLSLHGDHADKVVHNLKHLRSTIIELHLIDVISVEAQQGRTATDIGEQIYQMMAADLGPDYAPLDAENP